VHFVRKTELKDELVGPNVHALILNDLETDPTPSEISIYRIEPGQEVLFSALHYKGVRFAAWDSGHNYGFLTTTDQALTEQNLTFRKDREDEAGFEFLREAHFIVETPTPADRTRLAQVFAASKPTFVGRKTVSKAIVAERKNPTVTTAAEWTAVQAEADRRAKG